MDLNLNNHWFQVTAVSVIVFTLLWWYGYRSQMNFQDIENDRSLHKGNMLTGAGIFMFVPLCLIGLFLYPLFVPLYLILMISIVGILDDRFDLSFKLRLFLQALLATLILLYIKIDVSLILLMFLVFAFVWWVNLFNFMDGANGLAGIHALISLSFYALLFNSHFQHINVLHYLTMSATLVVFIYLLFNLWLKKMFMGDSGSLPLALLIGTVALYSFYYEVLNFMQIAMIHAIFIVDATMTLFNRLLKGENVAKAHATHLYQRLIKTGWTHSKVALIYGAVTLLCCLIAIVMGLPKIPVVALFMIVYVVLLVIFLKTLNIGR